MIAAPVQAASSPGELAAYVRARAADAAGELDRAATGYGLALTAAPDDAVIAIRAYRAAIAAGDYALIKRARRVLERADVAPADAAILALADAAVAGDIPAIAAAIDRIGKGPLEFMAPSLRAWSLVRDPKAALAVLDTAGGSPIGRRYAAESRALLMIADGRVDDGLALLQVLAGIDGNSLGLRVAAARLLAGQGRRDQAAAVLVGDDPFIAAMRGQISPSAATPAFGLSYVLTRLAGDIDDGKATRLAASLNRAVLRIDPDNDRARLLLAGALVGEKAPDRGIEVIDQIAATSPYARAAATQRVMLLDALGRKPEAIRAAAALAASPQATDDDLRRHADLLMAADSFAAAATAYRRVIAVNRRDPDWVLYLQLGAALDRAGDWNKARPALERAVALAPDQPVALNYLGYGLLEHGGNVAVARKLLEKASALKPGDLSILDSLAWAYFIGGDTARALPLLEKAAAGQPGNSDIAEHLGDAYWQAGRRYEARYAWRAATVRATSEAAARLAAKIADGPTSR